MHFGSRLALSLSLCLAGCALPSSPAQEPAEDSVPGPSHVTGHVFYVPALDAEGDIDECEPGGGRLFDADLSNGDGYGARISIGDDAFSTDLEFVTTEHDEDSRGGSVQFYGGWAEGALGYTARPASWMTLRPVFRFGVGAVVFDFDRLFDDTGGASALIGAGLEATFGGHVSARVDASGFLWGWPGETVGNGGFVALSLGVRF